MSRTAPPTRPGGSLTVKTLGGVKWNSLATAAVVFTQFIYAAIMARLLTPEAFGLMAAAMLALRFASYFARMGIGQALIQKPTLTNDEIRAGFTSATLLGTAFMVVTWLLAPLAEGFFSDPDVTSVLRAMSVVLLLSGVGVTAESLLRRELRFRELSTIEAGSHVVGTLGVGIGLAALGAGVWSLVAAALCQPALKATLFYLRVRHPLRPMWRLDVYRPLMGFGSRVSLISFMEYVGSTLDTMAVGRYAATAALGYYNRAFLLVSLPLEHAWTTLSKVLLPSMSRVQADTSRLKAAYLLVIRLSAGVLLPVCAGVAIASREIVLVVLGDQWVPVITLLPLIGLSGALKVFSHFSGVACEARAELNKKLALVAIHLLILAGFLMLAIGRPLWAYAAAFAAASVVEALGYFVMMRLVLGVATLQYVRTLMPALAASVVVAGAIAIVRMAALRQALPMVAILALDIVTGAAVLWGCFRFGPLNPIGRKIDDHLTRAGVALPGTAPRRMLNVLLGRRSWKYGVARGG